MLRTLVLLGTLTGILLAIGFVLGGIIGVTLALGLSIAINLFSYWYSDKIILKIYKAKEIKVGRVYHIVKKLAREAKLPMPRVYIIPSNIPNAFATGRSPKHSAVALTKGLLEFEEDEIEGVVAHELGHIKNRDILLSTMAATIAGAISYLAQITYWSMFGNSRGEGNIIALIPVVILAPIAALLIRLAISRSREMKADYTGAILTKNPAGLVSALRKISKFARENPIRGNPATSHMWIVNPFGQEWFSMLFSTHPPIAKRIEALEAMKAVRE